MVPLIDANKSLVSYADEITQGLIRSELSSLEFAFLHWLFKSSNISLPAVNPIEQPQKPFEFAVNGFLSASKIPIPKSWETGIEDLSARELISDSRDTFIYQPLETLGISIGVSQLSNNALSEWLFSNITVAHPSASLPALFKISKAILKNPAISNDSLYEELSRSLPSIQSTGRLDAKSIIELRKEYRNFTNTEKIAYCFCLHKVVSTSISKYLSDSNEADTRIAEIEAELETHKSNYASLVSYNLHQATRRASFLKLLAKLVVAGAAILILTQLAIPWVIDLWDTAEPIYAVVSDILAVVLIILGVSLNSHIKGVFENLKNRLIERRLKKLERKFQKWRSLNYNQEGQEYRSSQKSSGAD